MSDDTAPKSGVPYITFTDSTGETWLVWKVAQAAVSEIRGTLGTPESSSLDKAWLVFLSSASGETRRTAPVPRNWRTLEATELEKLVREAKAFRREK